MWKAEMRGQFLRMNMQRISACFFVFFLFGLATSGPIPKRRNKVLTCSRHCRVPKVTKFQYLSDQVYDYSYRIETSTYMSYSPQDATQLVIDALAQVHVISTCDMVLKLREVRTMESDPKSGKPLRKSDNSKDFRQELEKGTLRFAFLDGHISDVCPPEDESVWALNVKRGFLSVLQNNMKKLDAEQTVVETDVLGTCRTVYYPSGTGWFSNTIKKSRDQNNCTRSAKHSVKPDLHFGNKLLKSSLSGRQDCEQTIDWNGVLISATCIEQHHFRPLPGETTGAVTNVLQSIKFLKKRDRGKYSPPVYKRMGLEYESITETQEDTDKGREAALRAVRIMLRQLCEQPEILPETTDLFFQLVANIRRLGGPSLRVMYERVSGTSLCSDHLRAKKFFLDALAMAGTDTTVRLLTKALTSRNKEPLNTQFLLTTLTFIPNTTVVMLQAAKALLDHKEMSHTALLPVAGMVNNYCQQHPDCSTNPAVFRIMQHFRRVVGPQCYVNSAITEKVMLGLRAIGTAGHVTQAQEVLNNCLKRRHNPVGVRVAAVEAFRRMSCETAQRDRAQQVFEDTTEDAELRIASYLTIMQCVKRSEFRRLQRVLMMEANTQVLSFVFTHLTNLKKTGEDFGEDIEELFEKVDFQSKDLGRLQLSRNFAGHFLTDWLKLNTNLLWPSASSSASAASSWFPRSLTSNLTLNLLGEDIDFAEFGVRGEGLEFFMEDVLLPMLGRKRPSIGPKKRLEKLNKFNSLVFARILGNELGFQQLAGSGSLIKQLTSVKFFKDFISKLSMDGKTTISQSLILLDQTVTLPTACGFQLTVSMNSTASAQLHMSGTLDLRQALARPRALLVNGAVKPSAAVRVTGTITMDATVTRTALRMTGTVHTNTIVKGRVQVDRGKLYKIELDVPKEKMTILDARSEISFISNNHRRPMTLPTPGHRDLSVCTGNTGARVFGLDLCGEVHLPKSTSPESLHEALLKPSSTSVILYKRDSFTQYKFYAQHLKTKHSVNTQLAFSTPGSQVDRAFEVFLSASLKQRKLELRMTSPWKKAELTSAITITPKLKGARCVLTVDDKVMYGVISEVKVINSKAGVTITPLLELQRPNVKPMALIGSVTVGRYWKKFSFDFSLRGVSKIPPNLKVSVTNSKRELSVRGSVNLGEKDSYSLACGMFVTVTGKLALKTEISPFLYVNSPSRQLLSLTGRGDYRRDRILRADVKLMTDWTEPVSVQYVAAKTSTKNLVHYKLEAKVRSSVAMVSVDASADVKESQLLLTRLTLNHDIPALLPKDTVSLVTKLAGRRKSNFWTGIMQSTLESKVHSEFNFDIKLNAESHPTNSRVKLYYGHGADHVLNKKYVVFSSKMRHEIKNLQNVILAVTTTAEIPSENINMEVKASHSHNPKVLESRMSVNYGNNQQTQARLTLVNKSSKFLKIIGKALLFLPQSPRRVRRSQRKRSSKKRTPYFHLNMRLTENEAEYDIKAGAHIGRKKRDFSSSLNIRKPVSLRHIHMYCKGIPYSRTYQEFEAEFSHSMHPLLADVIETLVTRRPEVDISKSVQLLTSVTASSFLKNATKHGQFKVKSGDSVTPFSATVVEQLFSDYKAMTLDTYDDDDSNGGIVKLDAMDIKGGIDVKSSFVDLNVGSLNFEHVYDGMLHETNAAFDNNGAEYKYEMAVKDSLSHWLESNNGEVVVTTPKRKLSMEWQHEHADSKLRSTFLTSWGKNRRIYCDLSGRFEKTNRTEEFFSDVIMQTPWKPVRNWRVSVAHDAAPGLFRSKSTIRRNGLRKMSHQITVMHTSAFTDASIMIFTPWTKKISSNVISRHDVYPVSGTTELAWSPRQKITVKGLANLDAWDDTEMSINVKTTFPGVKSISGRISNSMYEGNLISDITAKYGTSNSFTVETVLRRRDWRKLRVRVLTPFDSFRILETGYQVDGGLRNLSSSADFRIFPIVNKYEASLVWMHGELFMGKFRLDTPLKSFPYAQVVMYSETKGKYRRSVVTLKHSPSQVYTIDTKYAMQTLDELKVVLKTTQKDYDRFDIEIHRERVRSLSEVLMNVSLPSDRNIVAVGHFNLEHGFKGSVSVSTPFAGFETSTAFFAFANNKFELSTEGNVTAGDRTVAARLLLMHDNNTDFSNQNLSSSKQVDVSRVAYATKLFCSLQKMEIYFNTATGNLRRSETETSLAKDKGTTVSAVYNRSPKSVTTKLQIVSGTVDDVHVSSNYTRTLEDVFLSLGLAFGKRFLIHSNATFVAAKLGTGSDKNMSVIGRSQKTKQLQIQKDMSNSYQETSFVFDAFERFTMNFETRAPFPMYNKFGIHTNIQRTNVPGLLGEQKTDLKKFEVSSSVPTQTMRVRGWAVNSLENVHGTSFDVSHTSLQDMRRTHAEFKTTLSEEGDVSVVFNNSGMLTNFTSTAQIDFKGKVLVKSVIHHMHGKNLLRSSVRLTNNYIDDVFMAFAYQGNQDSLGTNATVACGDKFHVQGAYTNSKHSFGIKKFTSEFAIDSARTGAVKSSADLAFNTSNPWKYLSGSFYNEINKQSGNVSFTFSDENYMDLSGRIMGMKRNKLDDIETVPRIVFTHKGIPSSFRTSLFIHQLHNDPFDTVISVKYKSLFDLNTQITLKSPYHFARDLNLMMKTSRNRNGEYRALLSSGWAPYKTISIDVLSKHLPNVLGLDHQTDIVMVTPFRDFQTGAVKISLNQILAKTDCSFEATVNDKTVLILGLKSNDPHSLGIRQPLLSLFQRNAAGFRPDEKSHRGNVFIRWNLTDPDSNLRMVTKISIVRNGAEIKDRGLNVTVIYPLRVMAVRYRSQKASNTVSGEGEVSWERAEESNKKIYYQYAMQHQSGSSASAYNGLLKLGNPLRSVEVNGSVVTNVSKSFVSRHSEPGQKMQKVDGVFYWDADGDRTKQVTLTSSVTRQGRRQSADISLAVPSVSQAVRLKTDLTTSTGLAVWNSTSSLSYSLDDPQKTLAFRTTLLDTSVHGDGSDFTMVTSLSQPSSDLDLGLTSNVGGNQSAYTGSLEGWFLTSQHQMRRAVWKGVFHRLTRNVNVTLKTPASEASVAIEHLSTGPYQMNLRGHILDIKNSHNDKHAAASLILDPFHRSLLLKLDHNLGDVWALEAWYVNDTALRAEVYRKHVTGSVTDSVLAVHLNTSTLVHARLKWRPEIPQELKVFTRNLLSTLDEYKLRTEQAIQRTVQSCEDELRLKYTAVTAPMANDFSFLLNLLASELDLLDRQVERIVTEFEELYRANEEYLASLGHEFGETGQHMINHLHVLHSSYRHSYIKVLEFVKTLMDRAGYSAILEKYKHFIHLLTEKLANAQMQGSEKMQEILASVDLYLLLVKNRMVEMSNTVSSMNSLQSFLDVAEAKLTSLRVRDSLQVAHERVKTWFSLSSDTSPLVTMTSTASEMLNQGTWIYSYLELGPHTQHHLASIADSLTDIIVAEIRFRLRHFRFLQKSRLTVWLPQQGEVQGEVCLPFPVTSLAIAPPIERRGIDASGSFSQRQSPARRKHSRKTLLR